MKKCDKGHDFICSKCGMSFDQRILELGDEGLEKVIPLFSQLRENL